MEYMEFGTAAMLAGGKSSRMGFDKQLLSAHEQRIFELVADTLKKEFSDVLVVTAKPELYQGMDVRVCSDEYRGMGPLGGIHAALKHAKSRYVYLIACDMPVVCLPYVRHMRERLAPTGAGVCVTRRGGRFEPFNAFYSRTLLEDLEERLRGGSTSLFHFISGANPLVIPEEEAAAFDGDFRMFTNINTRSEYDAYLRGIG